MARGNRLTTLVRLILAVPIIIISIFLAWQVVVPTFFMILFRKQISALVVRLESGGVEIHFQGQLLRAVAARWSIQPPMTNRLFTWT